MQSCYYYSVDMDLHYQTEGAGPVFICLHGGKGNSGDYFFPYLSPLADEFNMAYVDERGSGKSKPVPDSTHISYPGMAQDIENLIVHLGVENVALLGHSFGSCLAQYFALHYPHRVRELYLVAGATGYPKILREWWSEFFNEEMERLNIAPEVQKVYDRHNSGQITANESFRETVKIQAPSIIYHWPEKREEVYSVFARTDFTHLVPNNFGDELAVTADIFARLGEVRCPTLILAGQHDISTPLECLGGMARRIPTCEMRVIPRSRHFPFIDEPELFVEAIRQFRRTYALDTAAV
jgi:proline iminopeptidase